MLIICNVNMFAVEQIVKVGNEIHKVSMDRLGKVIAKMFSSNSEIEEIQLYGPEAFLAGIVDEIQTCYGLEYSKNTHDLKIEVNKYDLSC